MPKREEILFSQVGFPDYLAPDEVKNTEEYGLQMAKAIEYEWFYRPQTGRCSYYDKRDYYHNLRLYARGEQDTKIYRDLLTRDEDSSYTNYDWRPIQVVPKFIKLLTNQMTDRLFDIKAEAVDKYSTDLKDEYRKKLEKYVISKPVIEEIKQTMGMDLTPPNSDELPETQEEVDVFMNMKYKPAIEIAAEEAIKYTLELNDYEHIQSKIIEDVATIGLCGVKHYTDSQKGIQVKYVDPANMVYSYPTRANFSNVHYYGEVVRMTVNEVKRLSGDRFTDEEINSIAKLTSEWGRYHGQYNTNEGYYREDDLNNMMIDVMFYTFKSTNTHSYKKKRMGNGGYRMTKKPSTFSKKDPNYKGYDVEKRVYDVWYGGALILGTTKIFNYKLTENLVRTGDGLLNKTIPNYLLYAPDLYQNRAKSLVSTIIPYIDQMQQIHIKLQQQIAKARPNGIYIDVAGLNEIAIGDGNVLTPLEAVKIYDATGNVLGTSLTQEGEFNYGRQPIQELNNGVNAQGINALILSYNHYLNLVRDAIGIPQGADASLPHPDTLVGVQQQVALNSNTATRHILDSGLRISEMLGKAVSARIKDIFKYSNLKRAYINAIGKINVDLLKALENYHLHDLGVIITLKPDAQEMQFLEQNIATALSTDSITLDDAIDVRSISNIKLANEVLKVRRKRREQTKMQHEKEMEMTRAEGQAMLAERASQAKMQEMEFKTKSELAVVNAKSQAKMMELEKEAMVKAGLMDREFQYNRILQGQQSEIKERMEMSKEDRKDKRQTMNNNQQARIKQASQFNEAAPRFESSEDNISGGVELGELEPS